MNLYFLVGAGQLGICLVVAIILLSKADSEYIRKCTSAPLYKMSNKINTAPQPHAKITKACLPNNICSNLWLHSCIDIFSTPLIHASFKAGKDCLRKLFIVIFN